MPDTPDAPQPLKYEPLAMLHEADVSAEITKKPRGYCSVRIYRSYLPPQQKEAKITNWLGSKRQIRAAIVLLEKALALFEQNGAP